jgi:hypothetical protein
LFWNPLLSLPSFKFDKTALLLIETILISPILKRIEIMEN